VFDELVVVFDLGLAEAFLLEGTLIMLLVLFDFKMAGLKVHSGFDL